MIQMMNEDIAVVGEVTVKEQAETIPTIEKFIGLVDTIAKMILTQIYRPEKGVES
jgi:ribosomal 30S subunit maturation factor RimM